MNAIATTEPVSAQTLQHVLGTGDISKLSVPQKVEYYARVCQSLGLNPLTRPFRFLRLNNQEQLYATRDCTDQLRKVNGITLHVMSQKTEQDVYVVTVRARDKAGREDEDIGAVTVKQLQGESRANALMKAITKAKRRVTLSICGLGLTDESELDTMPGAYTFDAEAEPEKPSEKPASSDRERINKAVPLHPGPWAQQKILLLDRWPHLSEEWISAAVNSFLDVTSKLDLEELADELRQRLQKQSIPEANQRIGAAVQAARKRIAAQEAAAKPADAPVDDDPFAEVPLEDEVEIAGAEKVGAG